MLGSSSIENISFSRNCDIEIINTKSVMDASIRVVSISINSDMLEIAEHSLLKVTDHIAQTRPYDSKRVIEKWPCSICPLTCAF